MIESLRVGEPVDGDRLVGALERQLAAHAGTRRLLSITMPVAAAPPSMLFAALPGQVSCLWDDRDGGGGEVSVGVGVAQRLAASGPGRFRRLRRAAIRTASRGWVSSVGLSDPGLCDAGPATAPRAPRFYGGLAFKPGRPRGLWSPFGDAEFILPRWLYRQAEGAAHGSLTCSVFGQTLSAAERRRVVEELTTILRALALPASPALPTPPAELGGAFGARGFHVIPASDSAGQHSEAQLEADFLRRVDAALREIGERRFAKVVLARSRSWQLEGLGSTSGVLEVVSRLADRRPSIDAPGISSSGIRFAFGRPHDSRGSTRFPGVEAVGETVGETWFLGQTPERLVSLSGLDLATEALAGTLGAALPGRQLFESAKDLHEHQVVVRAILAALEPLCQQLDSPGEPQLLLLPGLTHLRTPITGRLRRPLHVLDVVAALHPTPAVGGFPASAARGWLAAHEGLDRGWYAAPVGWFDTAGDGELAVALRCGVLRASENRTELRTFAGAGIVAGSDPRLELDETDLKQRAFLTSLNFDFEESATRGASRLEGTP